MNQAEVPDGLPEWLKSWVRRWLQRRGHHQAVDDLDEAYACRKAKSGVWEARWGYVQDAWSICRRPRLGAYYAEEEHIYTQAPRSAMLKSYITTTLRHLLRQRGYTAINVLGLSMGLACCFLMLLFVQHELRYDAFHENSERIYRVVSERNNNGVIQKNAFLASAYAHDLPEFFPEIEQVVRFRVNGTPVLRANDRVLRAASFAFADTNVFDVFDFELLRGNPETALTDPSAVLLTAQAARDLFGAADPIGQVITYNNTLELVVTGILADVPSYSHLQFDYLATMEVMPRFWSADILDTYQTWLFYTYTLLQENTQAAQVAERMDAFLDTYQGEGASVQQDLLLQPLADVHFSTDVRNDVASNRDLQTLYIFGAIAFLVLLIAVVNFMNLATARASERAREVGLRKVLGADKRQLVTQFMGESVALSGLAMLGAMVWVVLVWPSFLGMIGEDIVLHKLLQPGWIVAFVVLGIGVGIVAGSYPALYLAAFQPTRVLKGEITRGRRGMWLRHTLTGVQFALSVFLIVGTLTVYQQLRFMLDQDLGFAGEQVVYLNTNAAIEGQIEGFKAALLQHNRISHVTLGGGTKPGNSSFVRTYHVPTPTGEVSWQAPTMLVDPDFVSTLGLEILEGRNFDWDRPTDRTQAYLINEAAARQLGWENPVGQSFQVWDAGPGQVIGVVKDFHFKSLHQAIEPVVLQMVPEGWSYWYVTARVAPDGLSETLAHIEQAWKQRAPDWPFEYAFLDQDFAALYAADQRTLQMMGYMAALAIVVTCLGLFALAAFSTRQRVKEIGVRKVLGASVPGLVLLLSKDVLLLVGVAFVASSPFTYAVLAQWLQNFAYRTPLGVGVFLWAGLLVVGLALATVSFQAIRAATANPIQALRHD